MIVSFSSGTGAPSDGSRVPIESIGEAVLAGVRLM